MKREENPLLVKSSRAASLLSVSSKTLYGMTYPRGSIRAIRVGNDYRYPVSELQRWINESLPSLESTGAAQ